MRDSCASNTTYVGRKIRNHAAVVLRHGLQESVGMGALLILAAPPCSTSFLTVVKRLSNRKRW